MPRYTEELRYREELPTLARLRSCRCSHFQVWKFIGRGLTCVDYIQKLNHFQSILRRTLEEQSKLGRRSLCCLCSTELRSSILLELNFKIICYFNEMVLFYCKTMARTKIYSPVKVRLGSSSSFFFV